MKPFDLAVLRDRLTRIGLRFGWPTATDLALHSHIVILHDLSRAKLGSRRFERVFQTARAAAIQITPGAHLVEAIYEQYRRAGYRFRFATSMAAIRFRLCYDAALAGRPSPLITTSR